MDSVRTPVGEQPPGILNIAVIGTGISGLAAAWLLGQRHRITVFEKEHRIGGHCHTVEVPTDDGSIPIDTGFMVYNERTYPNLAALFRLLGVPTRASTMSFSVSLDGGDLEYAGSGLDSFFAQRRNLLSRRHWRMLRDILTFYREGNALADENGEGRVSVGEFLSARGYSNGFIEDHLLPMAAAIWSITPEQVRDHPVDAFVRFFRNHGLLAFRDRPQWRTVVGGSAEYVRRLTSPFAARIRLGSQVKSVHRTSNGVSIDDGSGSVATFDQVVIAAHADQALAMLADADDRERRLLGDIKYRNNTAFLHRDEALMPRKRAIWSSWNYIGRRGNDTAAVTYWMNSLQAVPASNPIFVTLNPARPPEERSVIGRYSFEHPLSDRQAVLAQRELWSLQGKRNTWFCGAYFGAGFHEDGLQSGLAVAEALGGLRRPWAVRDESARIPAPPAQLPEWHPVEART